MAKHSGWLANARDLVRRRHKKRKVAEPRGGSLRSAESLEARLALALASFQNVGLPANRDAGLACDWAVVVGDNADNIYMQRVATGQVQPGDPQDPTGYQEQDLLYANNSSFLDKGAGTFGRVAGIDLRNSLYVTNGTRVQLSNVDYDKFPLTSAPAAPDPVFWDVPVQPLETTFVLSRPTIELGEAISGTITYAGQVWRFTNNVDPASQPFWGDYPNTNIEITGPAAGDLQTAPIGMVIERPAVASNDIVVTVTWNRFPVVASPADAPLMNITYDRNQAQRVSAVQDGIPIYTVRNQDFVTDIATASPGRVGYFTLPVTNLQPGGIVNGTLRGTVDANGDGIADFRFAPAQLFGPRENDLVFTDLTAANAVPTLTAQFKATDAAANARTMTGSYDPRTGTIMLRFLNPVTNAATAIQGASILDVTYATYTQDHLPSSATFFAGLDIHNEVYVDLLTSGSTINVDSPIIHENQDTRVGTGADTLPFVGADIELRATNVNVNATMSAFDRLLVGPSKVKFPAIAQARAYAVVGADPALPTYGQITSIVVPDGSGGLNYDPLVKAVNVTIGPPPPGGTQATATATVQKGKVVSVQVDNPGSGYDPASPPTVTIDPPYAQPPMPEIPTPYSGTARAFVVIDDNQPDAANPVGVVTAIVVPPGFGGQGYDPLNPPAVTITPAAGDVAGGGATAVAVVKNGVVVGITITAGGTGYTAIPTVTIDPPPDLPPIGPGFIDPVTGALPVPAPTGVAPVAEQVLINAAVAAQFYDIRIGDDPNTSGIPRGQLFVSTSGSLSGAIPTAPGVVNTAAQRIFVQANNADVIVEGRIYATEQTYLMQSVQPADPDPTDGLEPPHTPYVFTTRTPSTGAQTGLIRGGVLAVTLGNDSPTPEVGSNAINTVDLQTQVDSIRIKAATRAGAPLTGPFPYDLTITEVDGVAFDAVAASSRPITLAAGGDIRFNAALATASDLRIVSQGGFTVTAPVSTTRGQIDIAGTSVSVNDSLRVLDPVYDPARDDITLRATGGDINLVGLVSGVNNVRLVQANRTGARTYAAAPAGGLPIPDRSTVEQQIVVSDDFVFNDVNVTVDITHPYVSDLTVALVAPDGTVVQLFDRQGGDGDNLTNTVFDSEAATSITAGQAPFTGSFKPIQPLTTLYGRRAAGTWRLRVTDNAPQDAGTLNKFGLQFGVAGTQYGFVGGAARVVADRLSVESQGAVSISTNVNSLQGVAATGFTINEQDDVAVTSLRSGGLVSLRAAGVDPGLANPFTDNAIALTANLIDVTNLEVSAPAGSVEIITNAVQKLVLGRAQAIAAGLADPMQAAGDVTIRSRSADIDVLDAPVAGAPGLAVRVATTASLSAVYAQEVKYAQNVPGTRASTLTATRNGSLNAPGIDGVTNLWVGDRVLVKNQANANENGIYVVTSMGSTTTKWVLTRAGDADTTVELPANTKVAVQDGGQAGQVFALALYGNLVGTTPIVTTVVPNRPGAILVRAATAGSLLGNYDNKAGTAAATITATANGLLPLVGGVALAVGDRVLVRQGTHTVVDSGTSLPANVTGVSNGVYEVVSLGSATEKWQLQRVPEMDGLDENGNANANEMLGYVNVREGDLSTPAVGGIYRLAFDSLGIAGLSIVAPAAATMEIGSDPLSSMVTFVVSSNAGRNTAAGSLGKLLTLRQANATTRLVDGVASGTQAMDFRFSTLVAAPIQLTQQLPAVSKAVAIDGGRRYTPAGTTTSTTARVVVDGTRITRDRAGRTLFQASLSVTRQSASMLVVPATYSRFSEIRVGMLVSGTAIKSGARVTGINAATRTLTLTAGSVIGTGVTSVSIATEVNGLDIVSGSGSVMNPDPVTGLNVRQSGAVIANVTVGGFENGAAITIQDADGVLIRDTVIGQQAAGSRLASRVGVLLGSGVTSATLLNNTIVGNYDAGVRLRDDANGVVMVGNTIGTAALPNTIGVEVLSTGSNRIGVDPISPTTSLAAATVTRTPGSNTITLPVNYGALGSLFNNLGVKGAGIAAGARILSINAVTRVITLTLNGTTPGGVTSAGTGTVTFGNFVDTVQFANTLVLPMGVNMPDLFLGQVVSGAGIPGGTKITVIDLLTRTVTLSSALTATASGVAVTFAAPARNQIAYNRYGVWLAAGSHTVTNSDIFSNTFDGVQIVGGTQTVGTSKTASARSNAIYSNGGYGVNIVAPAVAGSQTVQGNYLGTRAPGNVRLPNVLGNVNPKLPQWTPNATTNVDQQGNVHGPGKTSGGSGGAGGGTPPGVPFPL